jgi:hypothetical protein
MRGDQGGCVWAQQSLTHRELNEKEIKGNKTVQMTDLAFSILRKNYPERNTIVTLLDDSGFTWKGKKNKSYKTNFLKGYLLIHRKTWYEDKFNATMRDPDIYRAYREKADKNFDDPSKKPAKFNFINDDAKEKLEPLYNNSTTWAEFIDKFINTYNDEKYVLMYDWYRQAIYTIFDGMEINQNWQIDISKRPHIECKPMSGGNKTRKNRRITFSKYNKLEPYSFSPDI